MRKSAFTEEQIALALRQAEGGTTVGEICRKLQVSEATFYRWKKKFGGLGVPELRELRQLREENRKLKQVVADLSLDRHILSEAVKKSGKPVLRRDAVRWARTAYRVSERRACRVLGVARSTVRYRSVRRSDEILRRRLRELAGVRVSYGYRQLHTLLRREGWPVNAKRVYRLYLRRGAGAAPEETESRRT